MRIKSVDSETLEADYTPMIDMTFQLIAFFMIAINFNETDQDERIRLPASELAKPATALENPIYINLTRGGDAIFGGQLVPLNALRPLLLQEGIQLEKNDKTPADATIIIRGHADAPTGKIQELIQICQEARFDKFALRAKEDLGIQGSRVPKTEPPGDPP
jgi:biopolymer transport protein ExbD